MAYFPSLRGQLEDLKQRVAQLEGRVDEEEPLSGEEEIVIEPTRPAWPVRLWRWFWTDD